MELTRADGGHTVQFGDESKTRTAAAAATAKLAIHVMTDREKGACTCEKQQKGHRGESKKACETSRTCHPRRKKRARSLSKPEKNQRRQQQRSPEQEFNADNVR